MKPRRALFYWFMKTSFCVWLVVCCGLWTRGAQNEQVKYLEDLSPGERHYLDRVTCHARSDFASASVDLTRDVRDKRLTVFAVVKGNGLSLTNIAGYSIETVYHPALNDTHENCVGSYFQHYNLGILDFALTQFARGSRELGLHLVRHLAVAYPTLTWSSPDIPPISIGTILARLETDSPQLRGILREAQRNSEFREQEFKCGS